LVLSDQNNSIFRIRRDRCEASELAKRGENREIRSKPKARQTNTNASGGKAKSRMNMAAEHVIAGSGHWMVKAAKWADAKLIPFGKASFGAGRARFAVVISRNERELDGLVGSRPVVKSLV
jgi:hypothetical protein